MGDNGTYRCKVAAFTHPTVGDHAEPSGRRNAPQKVSVAVLRCVLNHHWSCCEGQPMVLTGNTTPPRAFNQDSAGIQPYFLSAAAFAVVEFQRPSNGSFRFNADVSSVSEIISDWLSPLRERQQPAQWTASYTVVMAMNVNISYGFHWKTCYVQARGKDAHLQSSPQFSGCRVDVV